MSEKLTVMQVLDGTASKHGHRPAMRVKKGGRWVATSWSEYRDQVRLTARAFIHLGLEPGTGVSIIGYNSPEWFVADVAAIYAGGFPAGIYTTNSPEQCKYIAEHSDSSIAVVENAEQLAKFTEIRDQLPKLKAIIVIDNSGEGDDVYGWNDLAELAANVDEAALEERIAAQDPDDCCTLIYTSGTTGNPKAVMISHDNITWTARVSLEPYGGVTTDDRVISYLPLSHIAEQVISLHGPMVGGSCTSFAESIDKLGDNLREIRPTLFLGVPRVWEKIQAKIVAGAAQNSGLKKKIGIWAKGVGLKAGNAEQQGGSPPLLHGLANKLVFTKVRAALGLDQSRLQVTSAAPISRSTLEFFLSLGVRIVEVYGMSECTGPATISPAPDRYRTGKVGLPLPGTEVKIAKDGEICMRGRHVFKGYYKNPEATAEALDDEGWLHSGDIGEFDKEGFLQITDRKKDLIITAGGENIAPQLIEGLLKSIPAVSQAVVVGDRRKHLSALFTIDETKVKEAISQSGSPANDMATAAECPKVRDWLFKQVEGINQNLARVQTIKKIAILPADLSIEGGELTPTMKVKRKVVNQKYSDLIEAFYEA